MCKHHDQLHYPVLIREVATLLASGIPADRDMFLQVAAYAGMADLVERHSGCIPVDLRAKALSRLSAERTRLFRVCQDSFTRIHEEWAKQPTEEEVPF